MSRFTTSKRAGFRVSARSRRRVTRIGGWLLTVVTAAIIGIASAGHGAVGLGLAALVLAFGVFLADPVLLVVLALPGVLLVQRLGGANGNLSAADVLVFLGGVVSLFYVKWDKAPFLRQFIRGVIWYQAILILVVVAHPNRYNVVEWFHRFSYLGASVLCGWVISTYGRTKLAFQLFLGGSALLAVVAVENAVVNHFQPAQWGDFQKNSIGAIMWVAVVVAQINPPWAGIGKGMARVTKWLCLFGLLASQSRQAGILMVLALVVAFLLNPELRGRAKLILLGAIPVVVLLYYSFSINAKNNPKFNSVSIRVNQIQAAFHIWHLSPLLGVGMRFYNLDQYAYVTAPPNVIIDNLASTGIIGSLAFVVLVFITVRTMYRLPYVLGTLGLVVLLGHYVDGLFDIFWLGGPTVAPYIICGVCLGLADLERTTSAEVTEVVDLSTERRDGWARLSSGSRSLPGRGMVEAIGVSIREATARSIRTVAHIIPSH